ncbi:MAG: lipoate--protein ligase family protein [Planctomycetota bacterium]|jgi:lipoate-protein ligase A
MAWRLIETWDGAADWNLAVDTWLLEEPRDPGEAVLRFYTWSPAALSIGHFQRIEDIPEAAGREPGVGIVRRTTGGGAIHHANELTFSIAVQDDHPLYAGSIRDSYARVHGLIGDVLATRGVLWSLRDEQELDSERRGTGMCFHESHPLDVVWASDGGLRKGVGSAQRRKGGRVLHHGSIKLAPDPLEEGVAHVPDASDPRELAAALVPALTGLELDAEPLDASELAAIEARHLDFYRDPEWTFRR